MTELSNLILAQYQVRKTKKQKEAFLSLMKTHYPDLTVQEGGFPKCKNIIIGDVKAARVILCAHYDTCARMLVPNFVTPKKPLLSILYSLVLLLPIFLIVFLASILMNILGVDSVLQYYIALGFYLLYVVLMIGGPANKHTVNDNTSGVITLCELMSTLAPEDKVKAAFVFFDHEETGLIGSSVFRAQYKKDMKDKLLINFDCVSDGDHLLISLTKAARCQDLDAIKQAFCPTEDKHILLSDAERTYYPSDQLGFKRSIAVAALKHKKYIGYYMDRIHTTKDTNFDERNIKLIVSACQHLLHTS